MASKLKLWFDKEADYLEVLFWDRPGTFEETVHDQVMVRVDPQGNVLGFSIMGVSHLKEDFLDLALKPAVDTVQQD